MHQRVVHCYLTLCGGIHSEVLVVVSDPLSTTSSKALDAIGKNLQAQYERWQPRVRIVRFLGFSSRFLCFYWSYLDCHFLSAHVKLVFFPQAKYKVCLDPTVDEVKKLCLHCRKSAKNERVLFHYNGHGVPRPTINGEIWLFNKVRMLRSETV